MRFSKIVPLVLLDQWNWDQIVQIFYFTRVQLFLLFSGRTIGITLWQQRFLGFMGVKRFQGTIYSELFLFFLLPLVTSVTQKRGIWLYNDEKNRNQTGAWGSCIDNTGSYWIFLFLIIQYQFRNDKIHFLGYLIHRFFLAESYGAKAKHFKGMTFCWDVLGCIDCYYGHIFHARFRSSLTR